MRWSMFASWCALGLVFILADARGEAACAVDCLATYAKEISNCRLLPDAGARDSCLKAAEAGYHECRRSCDRKDCLKKCYAQCDRQYDVCVKKCGNDRECKGQCYEALKGCLEQCQRTASDLSQIPVHAE